MKFVLLSIFNISFTLFAQSYRIGTSWDKISINQASRDVQILKQSIGEVGARATLFYIGQQKGKHWAITNYHVCSQISEDKRLGNKCDNQWIQFHYFQNKRGVSLKGSIKRVPITIKKFDFSLLEINFENLNTFNRMPKALKLSAHPPYKGQKLISAGYGLYQNEYGQLMVEEDSKDCQVFSNKTKLLSDPDDMNPIPYQVYSFIHGCDVSHGDSGSPLLDSKTLEVIGLLWTGKYPKDPIVQTNKIDKLPFKSIWSELNLGSPIYMIKTELDQFFSQL